METSFELADDRTLIGRRNGKLVQVNFIGSAD